jgi:hypothetical protein
MENKFGLDEGAFCFYNCRFNKQTTSFTCQKVDGAIKFGLKRCNEGDEELIEEEE